MYGSDSFHLISKSSKRHFSILSIEVIMIRSWEGPISFPPSFKRSTLVISLLTIFSLGLSFYFLPAFLHDYKSASTTPAGFSDKTRICFDTLSGYIFLKKLHKNHNCWASASRLMPPASAFDISIRYRSIPLHDWVPLFLYWTGSGIGILFYSGTGLTGCRIVRHF